MAFKMKGPSLYRKGNENMKDGRAKSSAFQIGKKTMNPFKQTKVDLKEWLLDQKGFSQTEADQMIRDGAYDLNNKNFKKWYASKGDVPAEPKAPMKQAEQGDFEPAYEGGDYSFKDLQKMSKTQLVKKFGENAAKNIEKDLIEKGYKLKPGEQGPVKMKNKLKDPKNKMTPEQRKRIKDAKDKRIKDSRGKGLIMFTEEDIKKYSRKKK